MTKPTARPGRDRRNNRPDRPGAKPSGKNTGREARSEFKSKENRPKKNDRPLAKVRPAPKSETERGDNRPSKNKPFQKDKRAGVQRSSATEKPYSTDRRERAWKPTTTRRPIDKESREGTGRPSLTERPFSKERSETPQKRTSNIRPFEKDNRDNTSWRSKSEKPYQRRRNDNNEKGTSNNRPYEKDRREPAGHGPATGGRYERENKQGRPFITSATKSRKAPAPRKPYDDSLRLNRYIANAGVCSRREADQLIKNGAITVNGQIVTEMGIKVKPGDVIMYGTQKLINEKKVYILLNKPKDYITTTDDPQDRKTVTELIRNACRERVYPVGRLDRNTTGLLLLTNDGDLAKKLSHPMHGVRKLYHVHLDQPVTKTDLEQIANGVKIDNNLVVPDAVSYIDRAESKKEIGIEIHSGQNRVVRRIFEQLGYKVTKLDRVLYAGLTKKDLPRGKWRFLTEKELSFLKMLG